MAFDIDMIKQVYSTFASRIEAARKVTGKPLTLTEKILYAHLTEGNAGKAYGRGSDYVDFAHAGCHCTDGFVTVYAEWKNKSGCSLNSAL